MKEIILIGGGGHCRSVIDVIEQEDLSCQRRNCYYSAPTN